MCFSDCLFVENMEKSFHFREWGAQKKLLKKKIVEFTLNRKSLMFLFLFFGNSKLLYESTLSFTTCNFLV